jgi:hypothetical protein
VGGWFFWGGIVFKLTPPSTTGGDWTETVLYGGFGGGNGLIMDASGALYGTNAGDDVFKLTPPSTSAGAPARPRDSRKLTSDRRPATMKSLVSTLARQIRSYNYAIAAIPDPHPDCRWLPIQIAALHLPFDNESSPGLLAVGDLCLHTDGARAAPGAAWRRYTAR